MNDNKKLIIWFTGLPCSGKSTIAMALKKKIQKHINLVTLLDGDELRSKLNADLGFSTSDRDENIKRIAHLTEDFYNKGHLVIVATISPLQRHRDYARNIFAENMHEIFLSTKVNTCMERDVKGHYKLANEGKIKNFTGISSPYEIPVNPELSLDTSILSLDECVEKIYNLIPSRFFIKRTVF